MVISALAASLGSAAIGALSANHASYKQYKYQRKLMDHQGQLNYDYSRKTTLNQYNWMRQGLESANYNPLLAVQGSSGSVNANMASGSPSSPVVDYSNITDMIGSVNDAMLKSSQTNLANAQAQGTPELMASQTFKNNSSAWLDQYMSIQKQLENEFLPRYQKAELQRMKSMTYRNYMDANSSAYNAQTNRMVGVAQRSLALGQIDLMEKQGTLTDKQAQLISKQIKILPASQVGTFIRDLGIGIGSVVGAGVGAYQAFGPSGLKMPVGFVP